MIVWFCDNTRAFRSGLIIPRKIALPGHRRTFSPLPDALALVGRWSPKLSRRFQPHNFLWSPREPGSQGLACSSSLWPFPTPAFIGLVSPVKQLFGWPWTSPTKKPNTIIAGSRLVNTELAELLWALPSPWPNPAALLIASNAGWGHSSRNPPDPYPNTPQTLSTLQILYKISCLIRLLYHSRAWV